MSVDSGTDDAGASTGGGSATGTSPKQHGQEAMVHGKWWERGQNREGTTADSPRRSALSGKRWFGPAAMASRSKWKRMAVALLGELPIVVKDGMGVVRHGKAFRLVGWAREATS
jgi:hypothetical protein